MQHDPNSQFDEAAAGTAEATDDAANESQKDALIRLGTRADLWHDPDAEPYATFKAGEHKENHRLRSRTFKSWLVRQYYQERKGGPGSQAVQDALATLEAKAQFDGSEAAAELRVAGVRGEIFIDLGDPGWRAVRVTAEGWDVTADPPVRFIRSKGVRPLPIPESGGSLEDLRAFVNVGTEADFKLLLGWLIGSLRPRGPYAVLVLNGEQGSAKSTAARVLRNLVDPNKAPLRAVPREEKDLIVAARNGWVLSFDNLSRIPEWLSDGLCRLATGGGYGARQLYTDGEEFLFDGARPITVNGISSLAERPDLADRALVMLLPRIATEERLTEGEFWKLFEEKVPGLFGALLDATATALRNLPTIMEAAKRRPLPRMSDAALWVEAAAPALGWEPWSFLEIFTARQLQAQQKIAEGDPVARAVEKLMDTRQEWDGFSSDLYEALCAVVPPEEKDLKEWPKAPNSLTNRLRCAAPSIRAVGIEILEDARLHRTYWHLHKIIPAKDRSHRSDPSPRADSDASEGDRTDRSDDLHIQSTQADYEAEERAAIQTEPDPDLWKVAIFNVARDHDAAVDLAREMIAKDTAGRLSNQPHNKRPILKLNTEDRS